MSSSRAVWGYLYLSSLQNLIKIFIRSSATFLIFFFFSFLIIFHLVTLNERRFGSLMIISLPLEIKGAPKAAGAGGHICSLLHITRILLAKRYPPFLPTPFPPRGNGGLGARSLSLFHSLLLTSHYIEINIFRLLGYL